jgi:SpoVK/Ycf46/Vps4 family AAA+-type ATPase
LHTGVTFADIAGLDDVKETLRLRVIYPMQNPEKLARYGLEMGGGMLLYGPAGTGKTMVARAVAGELDLPFFPVVSSQILSEYYGQSEKQLARLFSEVREYPQGAVVFIDEVDAIGGSRRREGTSEPTRRLLNQLLQELDGIHGRPRGLLFLAATNEPWLLDEALLRPPRFTEKCYVPLPDAVARQTLLGHRLRDCPLDVDLDLAALAEKTEGYSGADLVNLCERAKLIPYRQSVLEGCDRALTVADFDQALGRVRPSVSAATVRRHEQWAAEN